MEPIPDFDVRTSTPAAPAPAAEQAPAPPALAPVVNHEPRLYTVHTLAPVRPPEGHTVDAHGSVRDPYGKIVPTARESIPHKIHPGLNMIEVAAAKQVYTDLGKLTHGKIEVAEVWNVGTPESYALRVAENTMSKSALSFWLERETRPSVRKAIEARLASGQAKAA